MIKKWEIIHGSCTAEVEFEFNNWVPQKATADLHSYGVWPSFLLFVYVCKWVVGKKPPLEWQLAVAATTDCHSSSGHHPWSLFQRWPWTQAQVMNSNSTSTGKEPQLFIYISYSTKITPTCCKEQDDWVSDPSRWDHMQELLAVRIPGTGPCRFSAHARLPSAARCAPNRLRSW